jgi:transcriptional regulator GlxA family with amidase domain
MAKRIGIVLFDGVEELDFVGPWEVLAAWTRGTPDDGYETVTVADTREPITCANGLRVLAETTWDDVGDLAVVVVPGGDTRAVAADTAFIERLRELRVGGTLMTSVCTGAHLLAASGALEGKPATTHWGAIERLRGMGVEVRERDRFVDAGDVVTSQGVSAGIDMALHLVSRLASPERALGVRRYIQYDPEPPV